MKEKPMRFDESSLGSLWAQASSFGPDERHLKHLKDHKEFCKKLTEKVLSLSNNIKIRVDARQFSFSDETDIGPFFNIEIEKKKVVVAPLRLIPKDLSEMGGPFRDITGKTYRLGGLVRVDCFECNETDLNRAFELAKKSFEVKKKTGPAAFFGDCKK